MRHTVRKLHAGFLGLIALAALCTHASAGPDPQAKWLTLSGRAVILAGSSFTDLSLAVPPCAQQKEFLVLGLLVVPEVQVGATSISVVNLPRWAASVPVFQRFTGAGIQVPLSVLGQGPEHASVTLPAGQSAGTGGSESPINVFINLLGGDPAMHRFEFNVHVTGACGEAAILP